MVKKTEKTLILELHLFRCGNAKPETVLTVALPDLKLKTTTKHVGDLERDLLQAWKDNMMKC
jgi:hypothetical protein